jgi:dihydrofolate synthase/folylpolyglutamate synthase
VKQQPSPTTTPHELADEQAASFLFESLRRARQVGALDGLDRDTRDLNPTRDLLARLGHPAQEVAYLLVTGSKGKGSTAVIAAKLLETAGFRVGLVTSPSLVSFRERIRVDGRAIPAPDFARLVERIAPLVEEIDADLPPDRYCSPTGMILALAQLYFAEQNVDAAVIEAGRGGRFDDTRLVPNRVAALTPVMYEHPAQLGPTLRDIAWNKAGIIPQGGTAISAAQDPLPLAVIRAEATALDARLYVLGHDFQAEFTRPLPDAAGIEMTLSTPWHDHGRLRVPLLGRYQVENVAVGVSAVEALLHEIGRPPTDDWSQGVQDALDRVRWPGRCQVLSRNTLTIIDGAINDESAHLFRDSIEHMIRHPVAVIVGVPADKDFGGVYHQMAQVAETLIITRAHNPHLHFPDDEEALNVARRHCRQVETAPDVQAAYQVARQRAGDGGTVLIVGTQSLLSDTLIAWGFSLETI